MKILSRLSGVFRARRGGSAGEVGSPRQVVSDELMSELRRELYGMGLREQLAVKQLVLMAGEMVLVHHDTVAMTRRKTPVCLKKNQRVRISDDPLAFDPQGRIQVNLLGERGRKLSVSLSDFSRGICVTEKHS